MKNLLYLFIYIYSVYLKQAQMVCMLCRKKEKLKVENEETLDNLSPHKKHICVTSKVHFA